MARAVLEHQREFVEGLVGKGLLSSKEAQPLLSAVALDLVARSQRSRAQVREVARKAVNSRARAASTRPQAW
jgi:hypothetical protein